MAARFASAEEEAEQQYTDAPGEETEDSQDWPEVGEDKMGTSKSTGKGDTPQQTEGIPPPAPQDPQPGTSKDPTDPPPLVDPTVAPPAVPTQDPTIAPPAAPTQDPTVAIPAEAEEETPPELTTYVKSYRQAGKTWLDMVLDRGEQAYITLYNRLSKMMQNIRKI